MDKHYTVMIIPEKDKGVRSFKIPGIIFRSFSVITVLISILIGILMYDYWMILQQIHENKHLGLENRQLREQIQLFQMKINSLASDIERVRTFEKKLRIITGLEDARSYGPIMKSREGQGEMMDDHSPSEAFPQSTSLEKSPTMDAFETNFNFDVEVIKEQSEYAQYKTLYDKKIAANLGLAKQYQITRQWSDLIKKSFSLSHQYAEFDTKYEKVKEAVTKLETHIHQLDQYLLDKNSILRSTPTILPAVGWITSYFGHRVSPYAGRVKMHEGLDVGAPYGTPIMAPADGVVTFAGHKPGFGNFVQIDHGYGIETLYAHAQTIETTNGALVQRGNMIAKVGSTGYSTGPHLHYEVRVNGVAVDPLYFVLE